jgi:phage tail-like protein
MADPTHANESLTPSAFTSDRLGFDTTAFRLRTRGARVANDRPPPAASAVASLRSRLPAIYQDDEFGLRFLGALETVLDPIVALLDCMHAHLDPDLAPRDVLGLMAAWLGIELDETSPQAGRRELLRNAADLGRRRGTRAGLELELRIAFPAVSLWVEDGGGVTYSHDPDKLPPPTGGGFVVYCDAQLSEPDAAALARVIERLKPVNVGYRLRIKAPRQKDATS